MKAKRICHQQTYPKIISKGSLLIRKETIREGNLGISGRKK
jgi:hypothetical protein